MRYSSKMTELQSLFDHAQDECYTVLQDTSFPRFKNSSLCSKLAEILHESDNQKTLTEQLGILPEELIKVPKNSSEV